MSESNLRPIIPFPALLLEEDAEKILIVADLHIGWEISLIEKGIYIPSQISRIQSKLIQIIKEHKPDRIIFLGDIKQSIPLISYEEWKSVPEFFEAIQELVNDISVILGNHDGDLEPLTPPSIKILPATGIVVGKYVRIGLFHGHAWPSPEVLGCEVLVMGHIHPVLWFRDKIGIWTVQQVWVKATCNEHELATAYLKYLNIRGADKAKFLEEKVNTKLRERKLVVIPAFNELVGGVSLNRLNRRLIGPLLKSRSVRINDAELYFLDGTYAGTVEQCQLISG